MSLVIVLRGSKAVAAETLLFTTVQSLYSDVQPSALHLSSAAWMASLIARRLVIS